MVTPADGMPGWQKNVAALAVASFVVSLGFVFVLPILPILMIDLVDDPGTATTWAGIAFAAAPLCGVFVMPFWGKLADRFGHRPMLIRAHVAIAIAFGLMAVATRPEHLVLLRMLIGIFGSFGASSYGAVAASAPRQQAARAISWLQVASISATALGPAIGGVLADMLGIRLPFISASVLVATSLVLVWVLFREPPRREPAAKAMPTEKQPAQLSFKMLWLGLFTGIFTDSVFGPMLPIYLAHLGAPTDWLGTITGVGYAFAGILTATAAYVIPRKLAGREAQILRSALVLGLLLTIPAALATIWWQIVPLRALAGLVTGAATSIAYGQAARTAKPGKEGSAMGSIMTGNLLGWATGALASGVIASLDLRAPFLVAAALLVMTIGLMSYQMATFRRRPAKSPTPAQPD